MTTQFPSTDFRDFSTHNQLPRAIPSHLHFFELIHASQQWCQPLRVITNSIRPLVLGSGLGGMYPIDDMDSDFTYYAEHG